MPVRVLHIATSLDRFAPASAMLPLALALPTEAFESHALTLAVNGPLRKELESSSLNFKLIERRWPADPIALGRLVLHLRRTHPQIVHAWDAAALEYVQLATKRSSGTKLVAEVRQLNNDVALTRFDLLNRLRNSVDCFVAPCEEIKNSASKHESKSARWQVITPGVELTNKQAAQREALLTELKLPSEALLLGVACPLEPRFGVKELIWAVDMLRVLHRSICMLILGSGPQRGHLERFARTAAEETDVRFLGDRADWQRIIANLDLFWDGSEPHAALQQPLLTALAAGVPVVASDTAIHRAFVVDGESGQLAKLADRAEWTRKTDALLADTKLAERLSSTARTQAEGQYSLSRCASEYAELYRTLTAK